jgi:hypothetical protein
MNLHSFADHYHGLISAFLGTALAATLLSWTVSRVDKKAVFINDKKILRYGTRVRILGWAIAAFTLPLLYALHKSSTYQSTAAICVGTGYVMLASFLLLEFHFVGVLFDSEFIYTFSAWRPARKIPWTDISGYTYSNFNKWHILHTTPPGNIRLSILLSGLGCFAQELKKRKIHMAMKNWNKSFQP